ncbi:MAG: rod shape-determining protein MreC [Oscillospiraceae bacterium]|nr:rod shape-determining protein MreC [Oscillospiraceae bacterium]
MKAFLKSAAFKTLAVVVGLLALGSLLASFMPTAATPANTIVGAIFSPLQTAASIAAERLEVFTLSFRSASHYAARVAELEATIAELKEQLVDYDKIKERNELYAQFYELKNENENFETAFASVVQRSPDMSTFTLNRGTLNGIEVGNTVVFGHNLVGIVASVSLNSATVNTLMNPNLNVGAYAINSSEELFTTTDPELAAQGLIKTPNLTLNSMLANGSVICTSGVTGLYPRGLIIGTVTEILDDPSNISKFAVIAPGADISHVRDVFVITAF